MKSAEFNKLIDDVIEILWEMDAVEVPYGGGIRVSYSGDELKTAVARIRALGAVKQ